jgi:mono/diheme cytochrome c family protein
VAAQLKTQRDATREFMHAKFEPELSGTLPLAQNTAAVNPAAARGKEIFEGRSCNACHGDDGVGTAAAPKLTGVGQKYSASQIESLLRKPTEKMSAGGMPAVDLKEPDMKLLMEYLESLK